jgi:hypothetical protein
VHFGPVAVRGWHVQLVGPVGLGFIGQVRVLEQAVRHVHPQARRAAVEPEPDHRGEQGGNIWIAPVPVWLLGSEQVQVPLPGAAAGLGHAGPRRAPERRWPVVRRQFPVGTAPVVEDEPGPFPAPWSRRQRGAEQRVLDRAVIGDQVDDHPDPVRLAVLDQGVEVRHGPEPRVHRAVVTDVVSAVGQRRGVERGQPDGVDAEVGQVRQARTEPGQITYAVPIRVGETAWVHLVDDRVFPPDMPVIAHASPLRSSASPNPSERSNHPRGRAGGRRVLPRGTLRTAGS